MPDTLILPDRLAELDRLTIDRGGHDRWDQGHCIMEVASWLAGEGHSDSPACVSKVLAQFLIRWNDDLDDEGRQRLAPYAARVIGTANDGHDELRGWLCADWLVRVHTPTWLELAGVTESAAALRALPLLRDLAGVDAARPKIDAAWDAAGAATGDAARAAARAAARDAARAAARDAAGDAAGDALTPTKQSLQASAALELLDRMIDPTGEGHGAAPDKQKTMGPVW